MAYSGTKTWTLTRDGIINAALRKIGEFDSSDGVLQTDASDAGIALNAIVKEWAAEGLALWTVQESVLLLQQGQRRYELRSGGADKWVDQSQLKSAALTTANASSAVLAITDTTWAVLGKAASTNKPSVGDIVGVRLDSGAMFWDTAAAVGTANQITLNNPLTGAAAIGRGVYAWTSASAHISRPLVVLAAQREDTTGNVAKVNLIGRTEYEELSRKTTSGDPVKVLFDPQLSLGTAAAGPYLYVWPTDNTLTTDKLILTTRHYSDDISTATQNAQFPIEWSNALIWNLAWELSYEYGLPPDLRRELGSIAAEKKSRLFNIIDTENASVEFAADVTGR